MPYPRGYARRPDYHEARRALAQHMHRHHHGGYVVGTLLERIAQHDELHWQLAQRAIDPGHRHAVLGDEETVMQAAHRYLKEGDDG